MVTTFPVVANDAYSKLAAGITANATELSVTTGEGANFPSTYPFYLSIEDEIVKVTNRSTDTMTIVREQESTTGVVHAISQFVSLNIISKSITDLNTAVNALEVMTTKGDIIYENATPTPARLAIGTDNYILAVATDVPAWKSPAAILADISPLTTRGDIMYRNATVDARLAKGADNTILAMGANDPEWKTPAVVLADMSGQASGAFDFNSQNVTGVNALTVTSISAVTLSGAIAGGDQAFTGVGDMTFTDGSILTAIDGAGTTLLIKAGGLSGTTFITLTSQSGGTDTMALATFGMGGAAITSHAQAITDNALVTIDDADAADNDYAKFTANGLEGRSYAEVKADLSLEIGTDVLAEQTIGISDDNLVEIDSASVADDEYARFTANGLESRSVTEMLGDLTGANLDVGAFDVRGATVTADGLTATRVVFAGASGLLSDDSDFTFSVDTLTVTKIGAFEAAGAINFASQNMTNVDIDSGTIGAVTLDGTMSLNGQSFSGAAIFDNALTTAGLVTMVASDVPQSLIEDSAGAGVAGYRMVGAHTFSSDDNLEAFITVTVPNNYMDGVIKILYQIHGNGTAKSMHSGEIFVDITRSNGANTGMSILQSIAEQTITSGGSPDTMTVTFSVSALTGAAGATQTFNVECTVDNSDNGLSYLKYRAELLTSMYTGGAGTKMSMVSV